jgi:hypothetical protein
MRLVNVADSAPVTHAGFKVYLLRVSTLQPRGGSYALGWKQIPRGAVDGSRPDDSTPIFAEMAPPGFAFEGDWQEKTFFTQPEIRRVVRWQESFDRSRIFEAANDYAARLLAAHKQYATWTGLDLLARQIDELEQRLADARQAGQCLLSLGWGGGLLSKSAWLDTGDPTYRQILQQVSVYGKALGSNLPFPKTRRIVFLNNKPASLPGWALLEVSRIAMEIQVGVEVLQVERLQGRSVFRGDVSEADVLADDRSIFALHQGVVIAVPRPALGLLDQQFVEQLGHDMVDELTAVVGMKPQNAEGKLPQHGLQHWFQSRFADLRGGAHHLPLRHFVHRIDVIDPLHPVPIPLVHGVHP